MRHRRRTRRLGCKTAHRKATLRNMVTSLIEHEKVVTTVPRAKELCRIADRMITLAKDGSLHARRQALRVVRTRKVVSKLFNELGPRFTDKNGGYTRVIKMGPRRGDAAMLSIVEFAVDPLERKKSKKRPKPQEKISEDIVPQAAQSEVVEQKDEGPVQAESVKAAEETAGQAEVSSENAEGAQEASGQVEDTQTQEEETDVTSQENAQEKEK